MKKILTLFLAAALALSLVACGGGNTTPDTQGTQGTQQDDTSAPPEDTSMTKEEMLEVAEELTYGDYNAAISENKLRAEETYKGNIYRISATVSKIEAEYCILLLGNYEIKAHLQKDDLINLNMNERINIVGSIDSIDPYIEMNDVYYIDNIYETTFEILTFIQSNGERTSCVGGNIRAYLDTETLSTLNIGDVITVKGNAYPLNTVEGVAAGIQYSVELKNAELVK